MKHSLSLYRDLLKTKLIAQKGLSWFNEASCVGVVVPHPDDEIIGCGGAISHHKKLKHTVSCCYLTDGSKSDSIPRKESDLKAIRKNEAKQVANNLYINNTEFWDIEDMSLTVCDDTIKKITIWLCSIKPDLIYVPSPFESHPDHFATCELLVRALEELRNNQNNIDDLSWINNCNIHFYSVWNICIYNCSLDITEYWQQKIKALSIYKSQKNYSIIELSTHMNRYAAIQNQTGGFTYCENFFRVHINNFSKTFKSIKELIENVFQCEYCNPHL